MTSIPILTCVVASVGFLLVTRLKRGLVIGPGGVFLLVLVSIFGIRPILMVTDQDFRFYGINTEAGYRYASIIGFLAVCSFLLGFGVEVVRGRTRLRLDRTSALSVSSGSGLSLRGGMIAAVSSALCWFAIIAVLGGGVGFLHVIFEGRSATEGAALANTPVAFQALPIGGCAVLAASAIEVQRFRRLTHGEWLSFLVAGASTLVPSLALGNRRFLIPCLLLLLLSASYSKKAEIVTLRMVAAVTGIGLVLIAIPYVRSAGARAPGQGLAGALVSYFGAQGIGGSLHDYFVSYDTEMFSYISVIGPQLGRLYPLGLGRGLFGDVLIQPLPESMAPQLWSNHLLTITFGGGCSYKCPVSSLPGIAVFDFGRAGVVAIMFVVGILCAKFEGAIKSSAQWKLLMVLVLSAFSPAIARGDFATQIWISANSIAIAMVLRRAVRRWSSVSLSSSVPAFGSGRAIRFIGESPAIYGSHAEPPVATFPDALDVSGARDPGSTGELSLPTKIIV